jgi:hypothetical protein
MVTTLRSLIRGCAIALLCFLIVGSAFGQAYEKRNDIRADGVFSGIDVRDLDGDGIPELVWAQCLIAPEYSMGDQRLLLVKVYTAHNHRWVLRDAFVTRKGTTRDSWPVQMTHYTLREEDTLKASGIVTGDLDGDGSKETVRIFSFRDEKEPPHHLGYDLLVTRNGRTVFQSRLVEPADLAGRDTPFSLDLIDLDGDGIREIVVWFDGYRGATRITVFASESSNWNTFELPGPPSSLGDVLAFCQGVRQCFPCEPCPVTVEAACARRLSIKEGIEISLTFKNRSTQKPVDLAAFRKHFLKHGVAYLAPSNQSKPNGTRVYWADFALTKDGTLKVQLSAEMCRVFETYPGGYHLWLEGAFPQPQLSKDFVGWSGTLRSNKCYLVCEPEEKTGE